MSIFKKSLFSVGAIILCTGILNANSFEQKGVKEGNTRLSFNFRTDKPANSDSSSTNLNITAGKFISDDIEVGIYTSLTSSTYEDETDSSFSIGLSSDYYFKKTLLFTPYTGGRLISTEGAMTSNAHLGAHYFFSEYASISPEIGLDFVDITEHSNTYLTASLTFFFD